MMPLIVEGCLLACVADAFLPAFLADPLRKLLRAISDAIPKMLPIILVLAIAVSDRNPLHDALLVFLALFQVKWVHAPGEDFHWAAGLVLFNLVAVRSDSVFLGVALVAYGILSFLYLPLDQEARMLNRASGHDGPKPRFKPAMIGAPEARRPRLWRWATMMWWPGWVIIGAAGFIAFPRGPEGFRTRSSGAFTNLSDEVSLRSASPLTLDERLVGSVSFVKGYPVTDSLYLRAGALDLVEEVTWTFKRGEQSPRPLGYTLHAQMPGVSDRTTLKPEDRFDARISVSDPTMKLLVAPPGTQSFIPPLWLFALGGGFHDVVRSTMPHEYHAIGTMPRMLASGWTSNEGVSVRDQWRMSQESLRTATVWPVPNYEKDKLRELGRQWIADEIARRALDDPNLVAAEAIAQNLRRRFRYSLAGLPPPVRGEPWNPIQRFLFDPEQNAGHCEVFAAAMTALLRVRGIPTRMVNGFITSEFDLVQNAWMIRRAGAHTWVEVWSDREGWVSFDPTPAAVFRSYQGREWYKVFRQWLDRFESPWIVRVLGYDGATQGRIFGSAAEVLRNAFRVIRSALTGWIEPFRWLQSKIANDPLLGRVFWAVMVAQAGVLILLAMRLARSWKVQRQSRRERLGTAQKYWVEVERRMRRVSYDNQPRATNETYREALQRMSHGVASMNEDPGLVRELAEFLEMTAYASLPRIRSWPALRQRLLQATR